MDFIRFLYHIKMLNICTLQYNKVSVQKVRPQKHLFFIKSENPVVNTSNNNK